MTTMAATSRPSPAAVPADSVDAVAQDLQPQLSLRERKKIKTRTAIRRAMYRLIAEQGYEATTVEQIAEAAEVSPSTVFRYFPTKEDIVLTDEFDPIMLRELRSRPAGEEPLESLRYVVTEAARLSLLHAREETLWRTALIAEVPALRARMMESVAATSRLLCGVLAERAGRSVDLEVRVFAMAVLGSLHEVSVYWAERGHEDDLLDLIARAMTTLKSGLPPTPPG
ncbi:MULTISPECIES: TetR/AcrR family transcriptional regulator [Streptomyces]|uniref:TetR/AcrR family transcriptional regulator n=1 Tax=Streptomyces TaxID=1883 RepID=UPI000C273EA3|nr:TetR family transcriptional regulator [Streptomyces sp. CB01201]MBX7465632.1 TetR family transcriptional regulator [Streptomyces sp. MAG02]PJN03041.1 TetR family transcriptional regulator [Streptomyces sp. CB01201]